MDIPTTEYGVRTAGSEGETEQNSPARPRGRMFSAGLHDLTVETIRDTRSFAALADEWRELLSRSNTQSVFLTWEWLFTWWTHIGAPASLNIITVRRGGRLVAVAPMTLRCARPARLWPFRSLEFLGSGVVGSDYLDVVMECGQEGEVTEVLARYLSGTRLMLDLNRVSAASTCVSRLASRLQRSRWFVLRQPSDVCPYVDLTGWSWESYVAGLGRSHRRNLRRRLSALQSRFKVSFDHSVTEAERVRDLQVFADLHRRRWAAKEEEDALDAPGMMSFHREWSRLALANRWLRLYVLRLNGRPVACVYGFAYRGVFYFYQSGSDPDFSSYSVGLVAVGLSIKHSIEEGLREYDMLHGGERYKYLWTSQTRELERLDLFPANVHGEVVLKVVQIRNALKRIVKSHSLLHRV